MQVQNRSNNQPAFGMAWTLCSKQLEKASLSELKKVERLIERNSSGLDEATRGVETFIKPKVSKGIVKKFIICSRVEPDCPEEARSMLFKALADMIMVPFRKPKYVAVLKAKGLKDDKFLDKVHHTALCAIDRFASLECKIYYKDHFLKYISKP